MGKTYKFIIALPVLLILSSCGSSNNSDSSDNIGKNVNACGTVTDIGVNNLVSGRLENSDCQYFSVFPETGGGDFSYVDEFRVTLATMGTLSITLRSTDGDALLFLVDTTTTCAAGCIDNLIIDFDDNGAGGTDAWINFPLDAGTYLIAVNFIRPGSGNYTLETAF